MVAVKITVLLIILFIFSFALIILGRELVNFTFHALSIENSLALVRDRLLKQGQTALPLGTTLRMPSVEQVASTLGAMRSLSRFRESAPSVSGVACTSIPV